MFNRAYKRPKPNDEAEKPFWISYSDLMTACMTLFLVVMAVTIVFLEDKYKPKPDYRGAAIKTCFAELKEDAKGKFPEAKFPENVEDSFRINLGSIVNFKTNDYQIAPDGIYFLRTYIPSVLHRLKSDSCKKYFRRVVVEGYTDTDGDYLTNLKLSLDRSRQVVCSLSPTVQSNVSLSNDEQNEVRDLFLVGGFSFNSFKLLKSESRRVELKLEFWQENEEAKYKKDNPNKIDLSNKAFGNC
jgi:outer membrane protein OmpA-like peptidoglycan-associated protein